MRTVLTTGDVSSAQTYAATPSKKSSGGEEKTNSSAVVVFYCNTTEGLVKKEAQGFRPSSLRYISDTPAPGLIRSAKTSAGREETRAVRKPLTHSMKRNPIGARPLRREAVWERPWGNRD